MLADLNGVEWMRLLDGVERFDVVVAADVLEHLYDPWATLRKMVSFIGPDGYLVVSLPHYWPCRRGLLFDEWRL